MKKRVLTTIIIVLAVIGFSVILLIKNNHNISIEIAKCIGENSELYIQLGCHACGIQLENFGENEKYLNVIDCFYEREKCEGIMYTPTWVINGEKYIGVQSIEELKELCGC